MATTKSELSALDNAIANLGNMSSLDDFLKTIQGPGSFGRAATNNLIGLNTSTKAPIPEARDSYGRVFFVRPQLCLVDTNLRNDRHMYNLLTKDAYSIHRYIRCLLDPRLATKLACPLLDNKLAFIPILSNNITNLSGWPDVVLGTFTSKEGVRREQIAMADSFIDIYEAFDLDTTFRNTRDEPISILLATWLRYMSAAFEGKMSPYMDFITENEMDYNTRIYRLVMDETDTYVKKIAANGYCFPTNDPTGKYFDYNDDKHYNDQNKEVNVRFKSIAAFYNDSILVKEFNETSGIFNHDIYNMLRNKQHNLVKVPRSLRQIFTSRAYPLINPNTTELEWYVDKTTAFYKNIVTLLSENLTKKVK